MLSNKQSWINSLLILRFDYIILSGEELKRKKEGL